MNSEFGWEFTPPMKRPGSDPYDNQTGEAEYGDRALIRDELDTAHEIIEIREID